MEEGAVVRFVRPLLSLSRGMFVGEGVVHVLGGPSRVWYLSGMRASVLSTILVRQRGEVADTCLFWHTCISSCPSIYFGQGPGRVGGMLSMKLTRTGPA